MKKGPPLFFEGFKLHSLPTVIPTQGLPDPLRGFAAASLGPARAQSDRNAAKKNVSERHGAFVRHRIHSFSNKMATVAADRPPQMFVDRRCMRNGQRLASVPLGYALSAVF